MIPCIGCEHEKRCAEQQLACRAYVYKDERGNNPVRKWHLMMNDQNVDYINRRIEAMSRNSTPAKIASWIRENASTKVMGDISFPDSIRHQLVRQLWRVIPAERLDLNDFLP